MRSFLSGTLVGSFLFLPFFVTCVLAVALMFTYEKYYLPLILAFLTDLILVSKGGGFLHIYFFVFISALIIYLIRIELKVRLWDHSYN